MTTKELVRAAISVRIIFFKEDDNSAAFQDEIFVLKKGDEVRLPCGNVVVGETVEDCIRRIASEQMGVKPEAVEDFYPSGATTIDIANTVDTIVLYMCVEIDNFVLPDEGAIWLSDPESLHEIDRNGVYQTMGFVEGEDEDADE